MRLYFKFGAVGCFLAMMILVPGPAIARPSTSSSGILSRHKRVSDQRMAQWDTLLALARMKGKYVTVPVAFGRVDPTKIGRRRRSNREDTLQKLRNTLQALVRNSLLVNDQDKHRIFLSPWKDEIDEVSEINFLSM